MTVRADADLPPTKLLIDKMKETLVDALNILRGLRPRQRHYLRDYPSGTSGRLPTPAREEDVLILGRAGVISHVGATYNLTLLGKIAQEEIWQAEQYIAEHYPYPD